MSWINIPLDFTEQNPALFGSDQGNQQKSQQRSVRVCGSCNFLNVSGIFCILVSRPVGFAWLDFRDYQ